MKNPFDNFENLLARGKAVSNDIEGDGITMPSPEHEGRKEISLFYHGDRTIMSIKQSLYDSLSNVSDERKCRLGDLLRAGLDKYGFIDDLCEKIINEKGEDITIPGPEHEGIKEFSLNYRGEEHIFTVKQSVYDSLIAIAKERNCKPGDLLRAGIDRYGLVDDLCTKLINEKK